MEWIKRLLFHSHSHEVSDIKFMAEKCKIFGATLERILTSEREMCIKIHDLFQIRLPFN